jgi:dTDP-4-dehydrorhamnose 3,5-epimerase
MEVKTSTVLPEIKIIKPAVFLDKRGYFLETYHAGRYIGDGIDAAFVQDNFSYSVRNVIRGLHYQIGTPQAKLVWVIEGEVLDIAVDIRCDSPSFGRWAGHLLSSENHLQLYVPEGFAHGFLVRSEQALVMYKCTDYYDRDRERGIRWDDPELDITWHAVNPILSEKDRHFPFLSAIAENELPAYPAPEQ